MLISYSLAMKIRNVKKAQEINLMQFIKKLDKNMDFLDIR